MKRLNGQELAGFIQERQARQVRALRQAHHVQPKLAIIQTTQHAVISTYVGLKRRYGEEILIEVDVHTVEQPEVLDLIARLNTDPSVHGIIVQLPLQHPGQTDEIVEAVTPEKDVDGLGSRAHFDPATPIAINWLLAGYNVTLANRPLVIVGQGRLVGSPLAKMWETSGYDVTVIDKENGDLKAALQKAEVVVSATGVSGLITSDMIRPDTVVVDAGTASEDGKIVGDVSPEVRERHDIVITPEKGGVGPLTIAALFDNVIRAASTTTETVPL